MASSLFFDTVQLMIFLDDCGKYQFSNFSDSVCPSETFIWSKGAPLFELTSAPEKIFLRPDFFQHYGTFAEKTQKLDLFFCSGNIGFRCVFLEVKFDTEKKSESLELVSFASLGILSGAPTLTVSGKLY